MDNCIPVTQPQLAGLTPEAGRLTAREGVDRAEGCGERVCNRRGKEGEGWPEGQLQELGRGSRASPRHNLSTG